MSSGRWWIRRSSRRRRVETESNEDKNHVDAFSRAQLVGAWFALAAVTMAASVVGGVAITIGVIELWLAVCLVAAGGRAAHLARRPTSDRRGAVAFGEQTVEGRPPVIKTRTLVGVGIGLFVSTQTLQSQDRSRYREFQLGSGLPAVTALTGVAASEVKSIHQRPAVIQELQWRPRYAIRVAAAAHTDAVQQITFSFYNDQLFKVVVDYDHDRTAGMTDADMIRKA